MPAINLTSRESFNKPIPDLETVRLIYTRKKEYKKGTVSIHLTRQDLLDIITEIDSMTDADKIGKGVRLYIARYPDKYPLLEANNKKVDYSKCMTVIAVPTFEGFSGINMDFMDEETVIKCKKEIQKNPLPPPAVGGLDHYHLCPPNTDCNTGATIWNNL